MFNDAGVGVSTIEKVTPKVIMIKGNAFVADPATGKLIIPELSTGSTGAKMAKTQANTQVKAVTDTITKAVTGIATPVLIVGGLLLVLLIRR